MPDHFSSPGPSRPDLPAQTSLRGIAALTVFIAHAEFFRAFPQFPAVRRGYDVFYWHGNAVDLFFVLSGFILCYVYLFRKFSWKQYALARFARIYPLYLAALIFFLLLNLLAYWRTGLFSATTTLPAILSNLCLIQSWPGLHFNTLIFPTWSISIEIFLYLLIFPLLCLLQKFTAPKWYGLLAVLPVVILCALYREKAFLSDPHNLLPSLRGTLCFTSGFFICLLGLANRFASVSRFIEAPVLLLVFGSLLFQFPFGRDYAVLGFPFLAYFCASPSSLISRLFTIRVLLWLGDISYSIYIWHIPLRKAVQVLIGIRQIGDIQAGVPSLGYSIFYVVLLTAVVLIVSHVSYYHFEMPLSRWLRGKSRSASPSPPSLQAR